MSYLPCPALPDVILDGLDPAIWLLAPDSGRWDLCAEGRGLVVKRRRAQGGSNLISLSLRFYEGCFGILRV